MAHATQLSPTEQDTLVKQIGLAILRTAPRDWQRISANFRTVGRYHELDGEITLAGGSRAEWVATHDITTLFNRLRAGMYREERGTWFNARYQLEAPASYNLEYDREEPDWKILPPTQAYADELRMFPRTDENIPEWLMRRLAGLAPQRRGPRFRIARVFDGTGQTGRPLIDRPELDVDEQDRILTYLGAAPVVLPGRGYDVDRLASTPEPAVPIAFHSDGTWIWPAAVNYYLQEYGVSPEPELVEHIKANAYEVPEVTDDKRSAAREYLTRGSTSAPQRPAMPSAPAMPGRAPAEPVGKHAAGVPEPAPAWQPPAEPAESRTHAGLSTQYYDVRADQEADDNGAGGDEPAVEQLRLKLRELGVPDEDYSIGEPRTNGWSLEEVPQGWRVGWYDDSLSNSSLFGDADDATAFMLGKVLLEPKGGRGRLSKSGAGAAVNGVGGADAAGAAPPDVSAALDPGMPEAPAPSAVTPPEPLPPTIAHPAPAPQPRTPVAPVAAGAPSQPGAWPIQPLPGEPPLTLFRGKSLVELPVGSELDRFGDPDGNLTYAAGTPFEERSVWPEWVHRPYHVYRVQQPIEVLSGVAIPWFNQPGGGSAYLLPSAIEDLLAQGVLVELDPGEAPVD